MPKRHVTLDDVAQSIANLSQKMDYGFRHADTRFDKVDERLDKVERRLTDVETNQRDMNERLGKVEKTTLALHNDIVELYSMV